MRFDLDILRVFSAVLAERTTARAAIELRTSRSNVRRVIQMLESRVGEPMFVTGTDGDLEPTAAARHLRREMAGLLGEVERFEDAVRAIHRSGRLLNVGVRKGLFHTAAFAAVARTLREDPRCRVSYVELKRGEDGAALESGACDLVISVEPVAGRRFECHELPEMPVMAAIAGGRPGDDPVEPAELAACDWALAKMAEGPRDEQVLRGLRESFGGRGSLCSYGNLVRWMENPDEAGARAMLCVRPVSSIRAEHVAFRPLACDARYPLSATHLRQHPFEFLEGVVRGAGNALLTPQG